MAQDVAPTSNRGVWIWAAIFVTAMFGAGIGARIAGLGGFWSMAVMVPPMLLLIPMIRSAERSGQASGCMSPALKLYNRRMLVWSFGYVAALFLAISINKSLQPEGVLLWAIAVLPALPIIYFVWSLYRYLIEESDEYLRMRYVTNALFALGLLMVVATIWGFLENFGAVPHVPSWAVVPVWALGLAIGQLWQRTRGA